jgi:hypothetical protein
MSEDRLNVPDRLRLLEIAMDISKFNGRYYIADIENIYNKLTLMIEKFSYESEIFKEYLKTID